MVKKHRRPPSYLGTMHESTEKLRRESYNPSYFDTIENEQITWVLKDGQMSLYLGREGIKR